MQSPKSGPLNAVIKFFKGDFDEMNVTLTESTTCKVKEEHPIPAYLFKFRASRPDSGKHNVTFHGPSKTPKFNIDELSAKKIEEMGEIVFIEGYNELNKEPLFVIRSNKFHHNGGETD